MPGLRCAPARGTNAHVLNQNCSLGSAALPQMVFEGADADQIKMMEERVILVDEDDNVVGAASKKECEAPFELAGGTAGEPWSLRFQAASARCIGPGAAYPVPYCPIVVIALCQASVCLRNAPPARPGPCAANVCWHASNPR